MTGWPVLEAVTELSGIPPVPGSLLHDCSAWRAEPSASTSSRPDRLVSAFQLRPEIRLCGFPRAAATVLAGEAGHTDQNQERSLLRCLCHVKGPTLSCTVDLVGHSNLMETSGLLPWLSSKYVRWVAKLKSFLISLLKYGRLASQFTPSCRDARAICLH